MSEMVERVARALCRQYELDDGFSAEQADHAAQGGVHRNFLEAARAAIEAMREPTDDMPTAWANCQLWRSMINEALPAPPVEAKSD